MSRGLWFAVSSLAVLWFTLGDGAVANPFSLSTPVVSSSLQDLWQDVAVRAAEATVISIQKQTGMKLSLRDVYMDTFQVKLGRQHTLGLELEGTKYELVLGSELDALKEEAQKDPAAKALPEATHSPSSPLPANPTSSDSHAVAETPHSHPPSQPNPPSSGSIVEQRWLQLRQQHTLLPDLTLAGPVELVLPAKTQLSAYLPNVAEVGPTRRIFIAEGATAMVRGLKALDLRYPVDLPSLPAQYLAEVYAHMQLGQPEPGFRHAPAILYMAQQLFRAATNATRPLKRPLLSFEAQASPAGLSLVAAAEQPGQVPPRLKARQLEDGSVEFSTRPGQVEVQERHHLLARALSLARPWAWPLPHVPMSEWLPYEVVLRSLMAQHPFNAAVLQERGSVRLRLTKSRVAGVKRLKFDMEVLGQLSQENKRPEHLVEMTGEEEAPPLEVWEATVQVDTEADGALKFTPLLAKQKVSYQDTFSISPLTIRLQTLGNHSLPLGYESDSLGIAEGAGP